MKKKHFKFNVGTTLIDRNCTKIKRRIIDYNIIGNNLEYIVIDPNDSRPSKFTLGITYFEDTYETEKFLRKIKPELFNE